MTPYRLGLLATLMASILWGVSPLFYHAMRHVPPGEVLAHRTLWSLLLFVIVLAMQGRLVQLRRALVSRDFRRLALAAVMISTNWFLYIWSVQSGHVVQASLGYYIFPLVSVLLGVAVFRERIAAVQIWAVALAAAAVVLLTWGLGVAPWISLAIATTFAIYGAIKKGLALSAVASVAAEVAILAPCAVLWLILLPEGRPAAFGSDAVTTLLLIASSGLTALPLMLISYAMQRADLATVGLIQYVNPTLQFICATLILGEAVTRWHLGAFALIWAALGLYSAGMLAARRHTAIRSVEP